MSDDDYLAAVELLGSARTIRLEDLGELIRTIDHYARKVIASDGRRLAARTVDYDRAEVERLWAVLSARATLEAAESSEVEARGLVAATRRIVFATWALAIVAVAAAVLSAVPS